MSALRKLKTDYTPEEYLTLEEKADFRSEYEDGEIVAMAGTSIGHVRIVRNLSNRLANKLSDDCEALTTDLKVWVETHRKFYYPDVIVLCGEPDFYKKRDDTILNPTVIFEVLSKSTEAKDRNEKFNAYLSLESLKEYVLVSQNKAKVEKFARQSNDSWLYQATIGLKSAVKIESINVELSFEEIYERVKL